MDEDCMVIPIEQARLMRDLRRTEALFAGWRGLRFLGVFWVVALLAPGLPWSTRVRRD